MKQLFAPQNLEFVSSCANMTHVSERVDISHKKQQTPNSIFEVCFIGRSNVGKSSLINAITNGNQVKVSHTPGRTQTLNFFYLKNAFYLIDIPGYGYAQAPVGVVKNWQKMIQDFLLQRLSQPISSNNTSTILESEITAQTDEWEQYKLEMKKKSDFFEQHKVIALKMIYLLIDSRREELKKSDVQYLKFLQKYRIPFTIILTKIDKVKHSFITERIEAILKHIYSNQDHHSMDSLPLILPSSSRKRENIQLLRQHILYNISNPNIENEYQVMQTIENLLQKREKNREELEKERSEVKEEKLKHTYQPFKINTQVQKSLKQEHSIVFVKKKSTSKVEPEYQITKIPKQSPFVYKSQLFDRVKRTKEEYAKYKKVEKLKGMKELSKKRK